MTDEALAGADPIAPFLERQGVLVLDGGLATELEARGHDLADELWSARLLADDPDAVREVHLAYLDAGADCITAASYQATLEGFQRTGWSETEAVELLLSSVRLAREARDAFWGEPGNRSHRQRPLVAASIGPYGAFLADGSEYTGAYDLDEAALTAFHRRRLALLATSGADLLACETIPSLHEARALAGLLTEHPDRRAWMSFSCRDGARLRDGSGLGAVLAELEGLANLVAVGVNCTAPEHLPALIDRARTATRRPIVVYPNSGETYDTATRRWLAGSSRVDFSQACRIWRQRGATLIGGCCRTGPPDIAALRATLLSREAEPQSPENEPGG